MIKEKIKMILQEQKAQISVEYLIMIIFGMILVISTGLIIINLNSFVTVAKSKILSYRDNLLTSL